MAEFSFIPGESFNGAVARWADTVAGLERMTDVTSHAGVLYGHRQSAPFASPQQIVALAAAMEVDARELLARATPPAPAAIRGPFGNLLFFGTPVPSLLLARNHRRFAPGAFLRSIADPDIGVAYDRAIWHVGLFPFDIDTWEYLLDRCPNPECAAKPGWQHTLGIDRCSRCMADLKSAPSTLVAADLRADLEMAVGLVHPDPTRRAASLAALPPVLAEVGVATTVELIVRLLPVIDPGIGAAHTDTLKAPKEQLARATARAWQVVAGWPDAMTALASARISTRTGRHADGNGGRTFAFMSVRRTTYMTKPLQGIVAAWRDSIHLQGSRGEHLLATTRTVTDAAKTLGIGSGILVDLRRAGGLRTVIVIELHRLVPRFCAAEIDDLDRSMGLCEPVDSARQPLGVSWHGVEQLVAMRLLDAAEHPFFELRYKSMQIVSASVCELQRRIEAGVRGDPSLCTIPLHQAFKAIGGRPKPWGPAFAALLDGSLPHVVAAGARPLSRRILLEAKGAASVRQLRFDGADPTFRAVRDERFMSKTDAAELLNLGDRQSAHLLSDIATRKGSRERVVPLARALELANEHITSSELAARRGVDTQRAYHDAIRAKVPHLGHGGFCRVAAEKGYFS